MVVLIARKRTVHRLPTTIGYFGGSGHRELVFRNNIDLQSKC